jgi:hypothetical protein
MTTANTTDQWCILTQHLRAVGAGGEGDHYPWKVYVNQFTGERTVPSRAERRRLRQVLAARTMDLARNASDYAAVRSRRVSSVELLDAYVARIEKLNPMVNAVVTLDVDRARQRALEADAAWAWGEWWGQAHERKSVALFDEDAQAAHAARRAARRTSPIGCRQPTRRWWSG